MGLTNKIVPDSSIQSGNLGQSGGPQNGMFSSQMAARRPSFRPPSSGGIEVPYAPTPNDMSAGFAAGGPQPGATTSPGSSVGPFMGSMMGPTMTSGQGQFNPIQQTDQQPPMAQMGGGGGGGPQQGPPNTSNIMQMFQQMMGGGGSTMQPGGIPQFGDPRQLGMPGMGSGQQQYGSQQAPGQTQFGGQNQLQGAPQTGNSQPGMQDLGGNWFTGHTNSVPTTPGDITGLRDQLMKMLQGNMGNISQGRPDLPGQEQIADPGQAQWMQLQQQFGSGNSPFQRNQVRDAAGAQVGSEGTSTDSIDKLGGANSAFFQNMMAQMSPAFAQRRAEGLAAAKEASGNLTGSGYANTLGSSVNRSLGDEQAALANYAVQGLGLESNRQQAGAGLANQRNIAGAQNATQASMANQGADLSFLGQLLGQGSQNLQAQGMGLQQGMSNQSAFGQNQAQNQNTALARSTNQAGLNQQRSMGIYDQQNSAANNDANRFQQLLQGMSTQGVGPNQITQSGGAAGALPGIGQFLGTPAGQNAIQQLMGMMGGGGMTQGNAVFNPQTGGYDAPGQGWMGALGKGAGTGASIGSIIPGVGTGIGAAVGAGIGGLGKLFGWG